MLATFDVAETLDGFSTLERDQFFSENPNLVHHAALLERLLKLSLQLKEV